MITVAFLAVAAATFGLLVLSPVRRSVIWMAAIAPLASIIGSGFLISTPLLARELGGLAIIGIAALCLVAWWIGGAIRFNIAHVEPMLGQDDAPASVRWLERASDVVLTFAYLISIAYYLVLLGAFASRAALGAPALGPARVVATGLLALIGWLGWSGGLRKVLSVEALVVAFKLAVIAGFLASLAAYGAGLLADGRSVAPPPAHLGPNSAPVLLGLLIMIQGFETSRFLGEQFEAEVRIRSMRLAQIVASAIYLAFFALMSPLLGDVAQGVGETAIIDVAAGLAPLLMAALTLGALASQFSASVADAVGCAGLAAGVIRGLESRRAFPLIALCSALVLWLTDVYGVVALASRAFAVFYMLQCLVAGSATVRLQGWTAAAVWRLGLAGFCAAAALLGMPAE